MHAHTNTQPLCYLRHHMFFHTRRGWGGGEAFSQQTFQACVYVCLLTLASNHPSKAHTGQRNTEPSGDATETHQSCKFITICQLELSSVCKVAWLKIETLFTAYSPSVIRLLSFPVVGELSMPASTPPPSSFFFPFPLRPCLPRLMKARARFFFSSF